MPSRTYTLFRDAILREQQVVCSYDGRTLRLANVRDARARSGRWHEGGSHKTEQRCVTDIDLDINIHVRKLR